MAINETADSMVKVTVRKDLAAGRHVARCKAR